jgi:transposase
LTCGSPPGDRTESDRRIRLRASFATDVAGFQALLRWLETFGAVTKIGIEGTGSYGSGLSGYLRRSGVEVIEVDRPGSTKASAERKIGSTRCRRGGPGTLSGRATGKPKSRDGAVEAIRVVAKRSARQARVKVLIQMRHFGFTAPDQLRSRLSALSVPALIAEGLKLRPTRSADPVMSAPRHRCPHGAPHVAEVRRSSWGIG